MVTSSHGVPLDAVRAGDCFNEPPSGPFDALPERACSTPHDDQVYFIYDMSPGAFPGDAVVGARAERKCAAEYAAHVARQDKVDFEMLTPTAGSWKAGGRGVMCYLYRTDGATITTSLYLANR